MTCYGEVDGWTNKTKLDHSVVVILVTMKTEH